MVLLSKACAIAVVVVTQTVAPTKRPMLFDQCPATPPVLCQIQSQDINHPLLAMCYDHSAVVNYYGPIRYLLET